MMQLDELEDSDHADQEPRVVLVAKQHRPLSFSSSSSSSSSSSLHEKFKTIAGIAGNILEWYDFAVFGYFSDVLGKVFFPKGQSGDLDVMESFAVFGGAFLCRPIGGVIIGYIGDVKGRKKALEISIFLMAIATTLMGCLPTYEQIGGAAIFLLLIVRMMQGLSVGGQLMSSLVFTVEGHPHNRWGLYGSFVMASGNFGTFLGGLVAYLIRSHLTEDQLYRWGWRIPFISGILISICGVYLRFFCQDDEILPGHSPVPTEDEHEVVEWVNHDGKEPMDEARDQSVLEKNPLRLAFSKENRRSLVASSMVPMLWSGGFYLCYVWLTIFMQDLLKPRVPSAFAVNSGSLLLVCGLFPVAGILSDVFGRKHVMVTGGVLFGVLGPLMIHKISGEAGGENWAPVFVFQSLLGCSLACWGAPMCAWLVEAFEPEARLTSVSIGYNVAQALAGGLSPVIATLLVDQVGNGAPGFLLSALSMISVVGLVVVAPASPAQGDNQDSTQIDDTAPASLELREIT